jgi:hypothetical protein
MRALHRAHQTRQRPPSAGLLRHGSLESQTWLECTATDAMQLLTAVETHEHLCRAEVGQLPHVTHAAAQGT